MNSIENDELKILMPYDKFMEYYNFLCEIKALLSPSNYIVFLSRVFRGKELIFIDTMINQLIASDYLSKNKIIMNTKNREKDAMAILFSERDVIKKHMTDKFYADHGISFEEYEAKESKFSLASLVLKALQFKNKKDLLDNVEDEDINNIVIKNYLKSEIKFPSLDDVVKKSLEVVKDLTDESYMVNILEDN